MRAWGIYDIWRACGAVWNVRPLVHITASLVKQRICWQNFAHVCGSRARESCGAYSDRCAGDRGCRRGACCGRRRAVEVVAMRVVKRGRRNPVKPVLVIIGCDEYLGCGPVVVEVVVVSGPQ